MSVQSLGIYHPDGRIKGSFVYMLLCQDRGGPIYIKIGITDKPTERLKTLRLGCPVTPLRFAFVEVWSRPKALAVESALHAAMEKWRAHGEWFKLHPAEKQDFNATWQAVFKAEEAPHWRFRWEQIAVGSFVRLLQQRRQYWRRNYRRRGQAYRDFLAHCK